MVNRIADCTEKYKNQIETVGICTEHRSAEEEILPKSAT